MALARRSQRGQAAIWPGFVDAMTGLLLVLTFVLTVFMFVQYVLRETISGQESALDELTRDVLQLSEALGAQRNRSQELDAELAAQRLEVSRLNALSARQSNALEQAQSEITAFEAQIASLILQRDQAQGQIAQLQSEQSRALDEQARLSTALASARDEINAQEEAARLAALQREAVEALLADLRAERDAQEQNLLGLRAELRSAQDALSEREAAELVQAAAAQALRERLAGADTELTAMTLALEQERRAAEETLTLLAAARAAEEALNAELEQQKQVQVTSLQELRSQADLRAALLAQAEQALAEEEKISLEAQRQTELLNQQIADLRARLGELSGLLDIAASEIDERDVQLVSLGAQLNDAIARAALEERRKRELEEAERQRLEAEAQDLERYRSEFFGRLRDVLEAQDGVRIVGDRFVFSSEVLFDPGQAELSAAGQREIAKIAGLLREISGDIPSDIDWVLQVDGHTDNVPISGRGEFQDNWELSQARALSVVRYMINFLGLPPDRLSANGFGEYQPIDSANTPQARATNRRIELKFTEK